MSTKQKLLYELEEILNSDAQFISEKNIFLQLKQTLVKNRSLSLKQQAFIWTTHRRLIIDMSKYVICDTYGHCDKGVGGAMTWGTDCRKETNLLFKIADSCSTHSFNDHNMACYHAVADTLVELQNKEMQNEHIILTSNSWMLVEEMIENASIVKNLNYEQKKGCKKYLQMFPNLKLIHTMKIYKHNIKELVMSQLKYSLMDAA